VLTILLGQGGWYSVRSGDTYGWVNASDVAPTGAGPARATEVAQAAPVATATQVLSRAAATTSASGGATLYVVDGPLLVRSGPGKSFQEIGSVPVGAPLQVHQTHPHWALVTTPDHVTGWVARPYLGQAAPARYSQAAAVGATAPPTAPAGLARVTTAMLNVRTQPDSHAPTITALLGGETVQILARRDGWDQVKLRSGTVGWANAAWLTDQPGYGDRDVHPVDRGR
jgi:uncharacterized protein YgiM (DUF1202 family)